MIFEAVDEEKFKSSVDIRFSKITQGLSDYYNGVLQINKKEDIKDKEKKIINLINEIVELNGVENSFVDFYYSRLSIEDRKSFKELLPIEDAYFFESLQKENLDGIYFYLSKEMIPFIVRLCTREILFSTFYFTKIPCTIWGNYNIEFPCFFKTEEDMNIYKDLCSKYCLQIL